MARPNFCSQCGTRLSETARFCEGCGRKIDAEDGPPVVAPPTVVLRSHAQPAVEPPKVASLVVCPSGAGTHRTIQSALDDVATDGRIDVRPGVYRESVTFRRRCTLAGTLESADAFQPCEGPHAVLSPTTGCTIDATVGGVVEGLAVLGADRAAAIRLSRSTGLTVRGCMLAVPERSVGLADMEPNGDAQLEVEGTTILGPGRAMVLSGRSSFARGSIQCAGGFQANMASFAGTSLDVPSPTHVNTNYAKAVFGDALPSIPDILQGDRRVPARTVVNLTDSTLASCMVANISFVFDGRSNRIVGGCVSDFALTREPVMVMEGAALALEDVEFGSGRYDQTKTDCAIRVSRRASLSAVGVRISGYRAGLVVEGLAVVRMERCEIVFCKVGIEADRAADVKTSGVKKPFFGASF